MIESYEFELVRQQLRDEAMVMTACTEVSQRLPVAPAPSSEASLQVSFQPPPVTMAAPAAAAAAPECCLATNAPSDVTDA